MGILPVWAHPCLFFHFSSIALFTSMQMFYSILLHLSHLFCDFLWGVLTLSILIRKPCMLTGQTSSAAFNGKAHAQLKTNQRCFYKCFSSVDSISCLKGTWKCAVTVLQLILYRIISASWGRTHSFFVCLWLSYRTGTSSGFTQPSYI